MSRDTSGNLFEFQADEATYRIFDVTAWCLVKYFHVGEEQDAIRLINSYFETHKAYLVEDDYHHFGPYEIASRIYYKLIALGNQEHYVEWRTKNGHNRPPLEYFLYYRAHGIL